MQVKTTTDNISNKTINTGGSIHQKTAHLGRYVIIYKNQDG